MKESEELTRRLILEAKNYLIEELERCKTVNINYLKNAVTEYMTKFIVDETDRKPIVIPVFMVV
jgi:mRNA degradation ribonuclease J1/J2